MLGAQKQKATPEGAAFQGNKDRLKPVRLKNSAGNARMSTFAVRLAAEVAHIDAIRTNRRRQHQRYNTEAHSHSPFMVNMPTIKVSTMIAVSAASFRIAPNVQVLVECQYPTTPTSDATVSA